MHQVVGQRPAILRAEVRHQCPKRPGIYGMLDGKDQLIYVGKAKSLRTRLLSYFRARSRDPKAGHIIQRTRMIAWEYTTSEFDALLRELELIQRWRPQFNVHGQPGRRSRTYLCLGRQPAPYLFLAQRPPAAVLARFGPIYAGRRSREAVRRFNDLFRLRDCPQSQEMVFADQGEFFPTLRAAGCLRHEIGTCLGPCAAACSRRKYADQVRAARAFLEGKDTSPLTALENEMAAASSACAFERAAILRDKLEPLRWLHQQLASLRHARQEHSFVYPVIGYEGKGVWYLICQGHVHAALAEPHDPTSGQSMADRLHELFSKKPGCSPHRSVDEVDSVLLVAAWFRRHPDERSRTIAPGPGPMPRFFPTSTAPAGA